MGTDYKYDLGVDLKWCWSRLNNNVPGVKKDPRD